MSEAATQTELKPILTGAGDDGSLIFARASALQEGDAVQGIFEGTARNEMTDKDDFKIRVTESSTITVKSKEGGVGPQELSEGDLVIVNGAGNLGYQMAQVTPGSLVRIEYKGKNVMAKGKFKGKAAHSFNVLK